MKKAEIFKWFAILSIAAIACSNNEKAYHSWGQVVNNKDTSWFASGEAKRIAENVLLYQRNIGGWPKNIPMQNVLTDSEKEQLRKKKEKPHGCTTDNWATVREMLFLSKIYRQVPDERYKIAFLKGLDYLLEAQYESGGWPQFYPLEEGYYTHITFNDNSMVNIMNLLKEIYSNSGYYSIVPDSSTQQRAKEAFRKGIECILKTQYVQNGVLTSWCAQHDETTFAPAKARAYELPSLSGQESAGIVLLLMSIDHPSPEIIHAVNSAVQWFEKTKITGIRVETYDSGIGQKEKRIVTDPGASPIWARFMELEDNTPFFCDRDGIKKPSMLDIGRERRVGYAWYSDQPQKVLDIYPSWKATWSNQDE